MATRAEVSAPRMQPLRLKAGRTPMTAVYAWRSLGSSEAARRPTEQARGSLALVQQWKAAERWLLPASRRSSMAAAAMVAFVPKRLAKKSEKTSMRANSFATA